VRVSKLRRVGLILILITCASVWAQLDPCTQEIPDLRQRGRTRAAEADDKQREEMRHTQQKKMNEERQSSLKKDTDELFSLASQLKESVDKSTQNTLSVEVIRKAQQIEKLAKNVREKMKGNLYCDLQAR
jgi:hypothetical protein